MHLVVVIMIIIIMIIIIISIIRRRQSLKKAFPTHFVGGVGVPDDEFSVLRGGHEVARVCAPVHRIHLQPEVFGSFYLRPCINVVTIIIIVIITTGIMMKMRPWTNVLGGFFASSSVFSRLAPCSPLP